MTIEIYARETCRRLKEIFKEYWSDDEKKNYGTLSTQIIHKPAWEEIQMIYYEINWKKRKFKKASRIPFHKKNLLKNEKEERKTISNIWNIKLNDHN